ncbi:MAG: universal stress protein [Micrococcales bacterium]|nr:universal stress protein [Micrococcales bacterium]
MYTVCVGVDGTRASRQALRFALDAAAQRGGRVRVVTAWWMGDSLPGTVETEKQIQERQAGAVQQAAVKHVSKQLENVPPVEREIVHDLAGPALVRRSSDDDHLVVGSEHKGALKHLLGASVSGYCIRHARIPVTVVPHVDRALAELSPREDDSAESHTVSENPEPDNPEQPDA